MRRGVLSRLRRLARCRKGATAVEFALVAPIFLIMMLGIFEVGRAMWIKAVMQFGLEEATRYALVNTSIATGTLETYAKGRMTGTFVSSASLTVTASSSISASVTYMQIVATYSFNVLVPIVPIPTVTLQAKSKFPIS